MRINKCGQCLASRRGRNAPCVFGIISGGIGRTMIHKTKNAQWLFRLLGEKVRMRADMAGGGGALRAGPPFWGGGQARVEHGRARQSPARRLPMVAVRKTRRARSDAPYLQAE